MEQLVVLGLGLQTLTLTTVLCSLAGQMFQKLELQDFQRLPEFCTLKDKCPQSPEEGSSSHGGRRLLVLPRSCQPHWPLFLRASWGTAWSWQGNESCSSVLHLPRSFLWPAEPSASSAWKRPQTYLRGWAASSRGQGPGALTLEADNVGSYPDSTTEVLYDCRLHLISVPQFPCV